MRSDRSYEVSCAASLDVPVLIVAGSAEVRGRIARAIHRSGPRRGAHWVRFLCDPEGGGDLAGSFARASGSTLFIDDVDLLNREQQEQLLALVETFASVDSASGSRDVRLVAGATSDLFDGVCARRFSERLLYRLNVIRIDGPAERSGQYEPAMTIPARVSAMGALA